MFQKFEQFSRNNPKLAPFIVSLIFILLPMVAQIFVLTSTDPEFAERRLLIQNVVLTTLLVFLVAIAQIWFFRYHIIERRRDEITVFTSPEEFCRNRLKIIRSTSAVEFPSNIIALTRCSLFAHPEGKTPKEKSTVELLNREAFGFIAREILKDGPVGRLQILLHGKDNDELKTELTSRYSLFEKAASNKDDITRNHFGCKSYMPTLLNDYFVFGDYIFLTVRKTAGSNAENSYFIIRSVELSSACRSWMEDIYEHGRIAGLVDEEICDELMERT